MIRSYIYQHQIIQKENEAKKKEWLVENVKKHTEAGLLCTVDRETFHMFTKNTWIGDLDASCHIANDDMAFMMSLRSMSWYKEVWAICLLQKRQALHESLSCQW